MSSNQETEEISDEIRPAGLIKRFIAFLVDDLILILIFLLIWSITKLTTDINLEASPKTNLIIFILIFIIYFTVLESSKWQASIGKKIAGLKIVNSENKQISMNRIFLRTICKGVLYFLNVFLVISMIKDDYNQMRYDEIVDSYVIDVKEKKKRSQVTSIIFGVITVIVSFVLLIGLYIGSYVGLFKYAQYVHHNGNTQQAIKIFSGMLGKYPHMKGFILFGRGDYYRILGKHKLAIRDLKKSLEIRKKEGYSKMGDTLEIYLYLYELYKKIDKEKIAKKYATEGINYGEKWIPEITDSDIKDGIYNNVAILYRKKQAFKKAIEYYTKAINLNNNYYGAYFNRSLVYRDIGKIDKALEDLNKCIMIDEKHNMAYYYKAYTFYEQNKYKEALKVIKKYRKVVGEVKDENIKKLEKIIKEEKANESKEK